MKVQDRSGGVEEYSRRLTNLSAVRSLLADLGKKGFAVSEGPSLIGGVGEVSAPSSLSPPDYVVIREDVLLYVYVSTRKERQLSADFAKGIWEALRENPSLSAVVIVWPGEGYPSICIDSFNARNYVERGESIDMSGEEAATLLTAIERFYASQFVDWEIPRNLNVPEQKSRVLGITDQLLKNLVDAFESEKARTLGIPEKIEAQARISGSDLEKLRNKLLELLSDEKLSRATFQELREYIQAMAKE